VRTFTALVVLLILLLAGFVVYQVKIHNPEVARELRSEPQGIRAARVMLMTIDDRKTIPVNYLREGNEVFVGADGPWWREMRNKGQPVTLLIKGEKFAGRARAVTGRPGYTKEVFARLRPTAPDWLPNWLSGVLVVVELTNAESGGIDSARQAEETADKQLEQRQDQSEANDQEIFVKEASQ